MVNRHRAWRHIILPGSRFHIIDLFHHGAGNNSSSADYVDLDSPPLPAMLLPAIPFRDPLNALFILTVFHTTLFLTKILKCHSQKESRWLTSTGLTDGTLCPSLRRLPCGERNGPRETAEPHVVHVLGQMLSCGVESPIGKSHRSGNQGVGIKKASLVMKPDDMEKFSFASL